MTTRPPRELQIPFDRVTYREGQLLASRDLHDDFDSVQRLRRMHTRFLHDTWGIALGFSVLGQIFDDSVQVAPGYALDNAAREILLSEDTLLPLPVTNEEVDILLVASCQPDSVYTDLTNVAALCAGSNIDPRNERPAFTWRTPLTLNLGLDVPLAHLTVQKGVLTRLPDLSVRRYVRRMVRPHIAGDVVVASGRDIINGVKVDTRAAGFAHTTEYFVRLDSGFGGIADILAQFGANSAYVESSSPKGFTYVASELDKFFPGSLPLPFLVTWIGVEPVTGCEPAAGIPMFVRAALASTQHFKGVTP